MSAFPRQHDSVFLVARMWHTFALRDLVPKRNFTSYEDVKVVSKKLLWLERICDKLCKTLGINSPADQIEPRKRGEACR